MTHSSSRYAMTVAILAAACVMTSTRAGAEARKPAAASPARAAFKSQTTPQDKLDAEYVAKLPRHGSGVDLDLSDPIQYRFFMRHWELAGANEQLYPHLFKLFAELHEQHLKLRTAMKASAPLNLKVDQTPQSTAEQPIVPLNFLTEFVPVGANGYSVTADSSVPGTLQTPGTVTTTTIALYDANNNQLAPATTVQQYGNGAYMANVNTAPNPTVSEAIIAQGSYFYTTYDSTTNKLVSHAGSLTARTTLVPASIMADNGQYVMQNIAPADVNNNNVIKICIVRTDADCDYKTTSTNGKFIVQFPISDTFTVPDPFQSLANQQALGWYQITITQVDAANGGTCMPLPANFNFWGGVTFPTTTSMFWNFNPGPFSNPNGQSQPCFPSNSNVVYDLQVQTVATGSGGGTNYYFGEVKTTTNPPPPPPPGAAYLVPMVIAYGCVADGALVTMADGTRKPIQDIAVGERVRSSSGGPALTVINKTSGVEPEDMIRIAVANNHSVLLTKTHPVLTSNGVAMAGDVKAGMDVSTADGSAKVVAVSRERFSGHVWNLDVGAPTDHVGLTSGNSTFIADGLIVGDTKMQKHVEDVKKQNIVAAARMRAVAPEWQIDARNYMKQHPDLDVATP